MNVPEWLVPVWVGFLVGSVVTLWLFGGLP
jgi:hypothetical protein